MKKLFLTWQDVEHQTQEILRQLQQDNWSPDYVVGLTRGGLIPANLISQYLECPMHTLKVSFRDDERTETSVWLSDEAFEGKKILIVDDINDTGATLSWIRQDWMSATPNSHQRWNSVWSDSTRVAVLYDNESSRSTLTADYSAVTINKAEEDLWIVFPWEDWWQR